MLQVLNHYHVLRNQQRRHDQSMNSENIRKIGQKIDVNKHSEKCV